MYGYFDAHQLVCTCDGDPLTEKSKSADIGVKSDGGSSPQDGEKVRDRIEQCTGRRGMASEGKKIISIPKTEKKLGRKNLYDGRIREHENQKKRNVYTEKQLTGAPGKQGMSHAGNFTRARKWFRRSPEWRSPPKA